MAHILAPGGARLAHKSGIDTANGRGRAVFAPLLFRRALLQLQAAATQAIGAKTAAGYFRPCQRRFIHPDSFGRQDLAVTGHEGRTLFPAVQTGNEAVAVIRPLQRHQPLTAIYPQEAVAVTGQGAILFRKGHHLDRVCVPLRRLGNAGLLISACISVFLIL